MLAFHPDYQRRKLHYLVRRRQDQMKLSRHATPVRQTVWAKIARHATEATLTPGSLASSEIRAFNSSGQRRRPFTPPVTSTGLRNLAVRSMEELSYVLPNVAESHIPRPSGKGPCRIAYAIRVCGKQSRCTLSC